MDFFRGDNRGPTDDSILAHGFAAKPPELPMDGPAAWRFAQLNVLGKSEGQLNTAAMTWRERTPGNLVASALTQGGAFQNMKYFYKFSIPDDELSAFEIGDGGALGHGFPIAQAPAKKAYFLICNNSSLPQADLIAFVHGKVNTKEATFFTTVPKKYIVGYRNGKNTINESCPFAPFLAPHRGTEPTPGFGVTKKLNRVWPPPQN